MKASGAALRRLDQEPFWSPSGKPYPIGWKHRYKVQTDGQVIWNGILGSMVPFRYGVGGDESPDESQAPWDLSWLATNTTTESAPLHWHVVTSAHDFSSETGAVVRVVSDGVTQQLRARLGALGDLARTDYRLSGLDPVAAGRALELIETMEWLPQLRALWADTFISLIFEGELQFEWSTSRGYAEIEIRRDGTLRVFVQAGGQRIATEVNDGDEALAVYVAALGNP